MTLENEAPKILTLQVAQQRYQKYLLGDDELDFSSYAVLEDAAAEWIVAHVHFALRLNGLTELSDAAASSLGRHAGDLRLDGLKCLSDAAAVSLTRHEGSLRLDGLTSLSDAAAASLSRHRGAVTLLFLTDLSPQAASALANAQSWVSVQTHLLPEPAAEILRARTPLQPTPTRITTPSRRKSLMSRFLQRFRYRGPQT